MSNSNSFWSRYDEFIGNGFCDQVLNHYECCFDGNDCEMPETCYETCPGNFILLGDGICHSHLNNVECCYDGLDCIAYKGNMQNYCETIRCSLFNTNIYVLSENRAKMDTIQTIEIEAKRDFSRGYRDFDQNDVFRRAYLPFKNQTKKFIVLETSVNG